jgi:flagellar basal-body rod modification protein FlgD
MADPITTPTTTSTPTAATTGTSSTGTTASGKTVTNPSSTVDTSMFLKLLVAQVSHQDPMQPTDSSQWLSQMAQMSSVEQLTNLSKTSTSAAKDAAVSRAVSLLGRTATYLNGSLSGTGTVEKVDFGGTNGPTLTIDGVAGITPDSLVAVK